MEKSNQLPKTEGCSAEGEPVDRCTTGTNDRREAYPGKSVSRKQDSPPAQAMQPRKQQTQAGTVSAYRNPKWKRPRLVRAWKACRGLRAWRARKQTHGTEEARRVPAALTTRAKQEGRRNDKKRHLTLRESDWPIVSSGKAQAPKREKGPTGQRSSHRQPAPQERRKPTGKPSCEP